MNPESELGQSSGSAELKQCLQGGQVFVIHNKQVSDRFTMSILREFDHTSKIADAQFSQDGKYIAIACKITAVIYDLGTGEQIASFSHEGELYATNFVHAISFTPDAEHLLCALSTGNVRIWNIKSRSGWTEEVGLEKSPGCSVAFSRDGSILVWSVPNLMRIIVCEIGSSPMIRERIVIRVKGSVVEMTISGDNKLLAGIVSYSSITSWDTETGTPITDIPTASPSYVAFSVTGHKLVVKEGNATISLRDFTHQDLSQHCSEIPVHSFPESVRDSMNNHHNYDFAWSSDDKWVFSAVGCGFIGLWSADGNPQFIVWTNEHWGIILLAKAYLMS